MVRTAFPVSGGPQRAMSDSRVPAVSGAPAFIENRRDPRFTLMFRAVKLIAGDGEYMGILRDASASGVRLQLFHPVPPVQHFVLEMANGDHHRMALVWERDGYAGFHFDERIDVSRLISDTGPYPKRAVRLGVDLAVQVSGRGLAPVQAMIRNLSQQGAQITCDAHLALDQIVQIRGEDLPDLSARVRWRKGDAYGLVLDRTFAFEELAHLLWRLRQTPDKVPASQVLPVPQASARFT